MEVAVVGAGELGGAVAHAVARRDAARVVRLVDESGTIAAGKALDLAQAAPVEGFAAQVVGTTDIASAAGASVIVVADRAAGGEWKDDEGASLIKRLATMAPTAVIVCAGAAARDAIDRAAGELRVNRSRVVGTAPEALAGAVRAMTALAVNVSPRDVALTLVGIPPARVVVAWEDATVAGCALTRLIDEPRRRRLIARIDALWPPGPYALAVAAASAVDVIAGRSRRILTVFAAPDRSAGLRARTAAWPVRLDRGGIADVLTPALSTAEQVAFENAMNL